MEFLLLLFIKRRTLQKIYLILFSILLFSGCGAERADRNRAAELCRLLYNQASGERCDSVVGLVSGFSADARLDVLLAVIRHSIIGDINNRRESIGGWLEEAARIAPKKRKVEVKMEELRFRMKISYANTEVFNKIIQEYHDLEKTHRLTPRQQARNLYYKLGFFQDSDLLNAWLWMKEALQLAHRENEPLLELEMLEYFTVIAIARGDYEWGMALNEEAYRLRKREKLLADEWKYWSNMEDCLFRQKRYPEAIRCWDELLRQSVDSANENNIKLVLFGKLKIFLAADSLHCALDVLRQQEKIEQSSFVKADVWGKMAVIFERLSVNDSAEIYFGRAAECYEKLYGDDTKGVSPNIIPVYNGYSRVLWKREHKQEALRLLEKATLRIPRYSPSIDVAGDIYLQPYLDALLLLGKYYQEEGNENMALKMLFRRDSLRDKFQDSDVWYKKRQLTERYRNQELQARVQLQQLQLSVRKRMLVTVSLICLALVGMLGMLWMLYRQKQRRLDDIYRKQKEVERLERQQAHTIVEDSPETILFNKLEKLVMEQRLFCKPDLSLDNLCSLAGSNRSYVSACINSGSGMNFSAWMNKIRVDYVLVLIREGCDDLTGLLVMAGFASKTSFYRNFKQVTQMTPKQYLDRERRGGARRPV